MLTGLRRNKKGGQSVSWILSLSVECLFHLVPGRKMRIREKKKKCTGVLKSISENSQTPRL